MIYELHLSNCLLLWRTAKEGFVSVKRGSFIPGNTPWHAFYPLININKSLALWIIKGQVSSSRCFFSETANFLFLGQSLCTRDGSYCTTDTFFVDCLGPQTGAVGHLEASI